jgi:outer membrane receptor protein involved in Fe transport
MKAVRVLLVLLLALAATGNLAWAGTSGKISGSVIDAETRESLPGAVITLLGTAMGANTDMDGRYSIINVPVGTFSVQAKMMGYESQTFTGIKAIMDLTTTLNFKLKSTIIEMIGVEVKGDRGVIQVRADITSTTKTVSTKEIENMAGVRSYQDVVAGQSGVVESSGGGSGSSGGIHIRGGRANEIAYFVDGLSTQDQVTGTSGANINNNAIQEVMVITGGFNAEYGSAMSGVVNVVTKSGSSKLEGMMRVRTDAVFPKDNELNFGYNGLEANLGGPIYKLTDFKFFLSGETYRRQYADEWAAYPHTEREFYSGQAKLTMDKRMFKASIGGFLSRTQYGNFYGRDYNSDFHYNIGGNLSRLQKSQQVQTTITHMLSKDIFYNANLAYFITTTTVGVRKHNKSGFEGWFADYEFKEPYVNTWFTDPTNAFYTGDTLEGYRDFNKDAADSNPYGVAKFFYVGDYPSYSKRESKYTLGRFDMTAQVNQAHQLKSGLEIKFNTVKYHRVSYPASSVVDSVGTVNYTYQPDNYTYYPFQGSFYIQDKMEFQGLVVNAGIRLDMLNTQAEHVADVTDLQSITWIKTSMKYKVSPRLGVSFPLSEATALRFSYGQFFQQPDMQYLYENVSIVAVSNNLSFLGNPDLNAQQTTSFELGLQHQFSATLLANLTAYYKDIYHLLGTRRILAVPRAYYLYIDADYGNVKGAEIQIDAQLTRWLSARGSYALSMARGSSSYVFEVYTTNYNAGTEDWVPKQDYNLEYDQRHNISASLSLGLEQGDGPKIFGIRPLEMLSANINTNAGSGYPYTKTDLDNKPLELNNSSRLPWTFSTDMRISRDFKVWRLSPSLFLEIDNLFNNQNVAAVYTATGEPESDGWYEGGKLEVYRTPITRYYSDGSPNPLYSIKADLNRDDYISAEEHYLAAVKAHDELQRNGLNSFPYEQSRRIKLGMSISF